MVKALVVAAVLAASPAWAAVRKPQGTPIITSLKSDIASRSSSSFDSILERWERQYGPEAVEPLLSIAGDKHNQDADRYIALMGAARLGGRSTARQFVRFLRDNAWMVRNAALRVLTAFENPDTAEAVLPLLKDPALVVRVEAVAAVEKLHPIGAVNALLNALSRPENYHGGKAMWVPQKVLNALVTLGAKEAAPHLRPLLDHKNDPALLNVVIDTLEALTGKNPSEPDVELTERVRAWKATLSQN